MMNFPSSGSPPNPVPASAADQPLAMSVHTMPEPFEQGELASQKTRQGRRKMLAVLLVCAAPVIASYFTYFVLRPEGRRNFGELIEPQRSLPNLAAQQLDGKAVNLRQLKGQWLLISVAGGTCDAMCQNHLYLQRQMRTALGKEKERLDWVWLVSDSATPPAALQPALKDATVLRVDAAALAQWLAPVPGHTLTEHVYVVDPMGNWMLRFPAGMDRAGASKAKKDLDRLLRASAFWDTPGRDATAAETK